MHEKRQRKKDMELGAKAIAAKRDVTVLTTGLLEILRAQELMNRAHDLINQNIKSYLLSDLSRQTS